MPNAPETRQFNPAGTSKTADLDQLVNLFRFPAIYQLAELIAPALAPRTNRGRKAAYGTACLLGLTVAARISGSTPEALKTVGHPAIWQEIREAYAEMTDGDMLPLTPPSKDPINAFRKALTTTEGLMPQVQLRFRKLALAQARLHGNLASGETPDWTRPREEHIVYGDGVIMRPYSDATVHIHPDTEEQVILGSRATDPARARVQDVLTATEEDGKRAVGINFVALHTWTEVGRVVLGTDVALGAEQWAALDLIDSLAELAAGGVHTAVWDRALTGWHVDYLMGRHRIQVLGLAAGAAENKKKANQDPWALREKALEELTNRLAAEYKVKEPTTATKRIIRHDVLTEIFHSGRHRPVGTCLYPYRGSFQVVYSRYHELRVSHSTLLGECWHDLVIDDEALHTLGVDPLEGYLVKTGYIRCTSATPFQRPDGRWGRRSTYEIPCGEGTFTYTYTWLADGTRYTPDSPESSRNPSDMIGQAMRSLTRMDGRFTRHYYPGRNDSESYNNWVQNSTPHYGRVTSEGLPRQALDFLCAAIVNNSDTWARSQNF